jgi:hypothetical protein
MGQLESLRELSIAQPDQKKKKKIKKKKIKLLLLCLGHLILMGIPMNFEILNYCTLELI